MIGLIQRVSQARVVVDGASVGEIDAGILLLLGVEKSDNETNAEELLNKVINLRIFEDSDGKMNRSLLDSQGGLLVVPQFTLAANTDKGTRPSFASAAPPDMAKSMYENFVAMAKRKLASVATGQFAADMKVTLTNDGPVTFWLQK